MSSTLRPREVEAPPVETEDLNVTLLGHFASDREWRASRSSRIRSGSAAALSIGRDDSERRRLVQVGKNRAIVEHNGHRVALEIPKDSLGQPGDDEEVADVGRRARHTPLAVHS